MPYFPKWEVGVVSRQDTCLFNTAVSSEGYLKSAVLTD